MLPPFGMLLAFVHVVEVFLGERVARLISLETLIRLRQLLELRLVARFLHIRVVYSCELQIRSLQLRLRHTR